MRIKLDLRLIAFLVVIVIVLAVAYNYLKPAPPTVLNLPNNVKYAVEYFNSKEQNSTLLVPSFYAQAAYLSQNGNRVIVNDTMYANILFSGKKYKGVDFVLISLPLVENLSYFYSYLNLTPPQIVFFNSSYSIKNLSSTYRGCALFKSSFNALLYCEIYFLDRPIGVITFANMPPNVTKTEVINSSLVISSDYSQTYVKSDVSQNSSNVVGGTAFIYPNVAVMYIPPELYDTFYGRYEFSPDSSLKGVLADFYGFKVVNISGQ